MSARKKNIAEDITRDPRWAAVQARAGGSFFYSVATTGVYCRPSCRARSPRPENVAFHDSTREAERAGFRACKRCKPDQPDRQEALVAELCRFIEASDEVPTLDALAKKAGLSPFHTHRLFRAATGLTPRAYAVARRSERLRRQLDGAASVTAAMHDAGYRSSSRFYESASRVLGMTPSAYRSGGARVEIRYAGARCSLGSVLVAASALGVCAILLGDDPAELTRDLHRRFARATLLAGDTSFEALVARVIALVEQPRRASALPLDIRGTAFQERVWRALSAIPAGETRTYAEIARAIGAPGAARAVARACAANPLAVAIPCHRVVREDGESSGYRWGIERKRALLDREAPE